MWYLKARYILPVDTPPIEDGFVGVQNGKIADVRRDRPPAHNAPVTDYGNAVILPGFVNAHTHLELTYTAGRVLPSPDFADWLQRLMREFTAHPPTEELIRQSVRDGIEQSIRAGVTTVGDITRFPKWTRPELASSCLRCISFGEVIAIGRQRHLLGTRLREATDRASESERLQIAVSPHAPYTVEPQALKLCVEASRKLGTPSCIHVAESEAEEEFTRSGSGPLAEHLRRLGVWDDEIPISGSSPVALLDSCHALSPQTILAHANYLSDDDTLLIQQSGAHVAYCPRTHHAFGHIAHRWQELAASGVNVCIGTDSLASNPSLSVLDEVRFLHRRHLNFPADELIRMATIGGAQALGVAHRVGTITPGKDADLIVLPSSSGDAESVGRAILQSDTLPLQVYTSGHARLP